MQGAKTDERDISCGRSDGGSATSGTPAGADTPTVPADGGSFVPEHLQQYLRRAEREHDLLLARTNIFLVYNSILMAAFALGTNAHTVVTLLATIGMLTSVVWIYTGQRSLTTAAYFWERVIASEATLAPGSRVFTEFFDWRNQARWTPFGISTAVCIGRVLPWLWALTWLAVAMIANR